MVAFMTVRTRELTFRTRRYQYCWICRLIPESQRSSTSLQDKHARTTAAVYRRACTNPRGRAVCTARHQGQRNRFTRTGVSYPSKYRVTYPWPHTGAPSHRGHCSRRGQGYDLPFSNKSFTETGNWSTKIQLYPWERVTGIGGQTKRTPAALSPCYFNLHKPHLHTEYREKMLPHPGRLMGEVTWSC